MFLKKKLGVRLHSTTVEIINKQLEQHPRVWRNASEFVRSAIHNFDKAIEDKTFTALKELEVPR